MQNTPDERLKNDLLVEIQNLENHYEVIKSYLLGAEYDTIAVRGSLQRFRDGLDKVSAYILAFYNLKGQNIKIPWDPLFTNMDYALATMGTSPNPKHRAAIKLALTMSEPKIQQVMEYLSALKQSLK